MSKKPKPKTSPLRIGKQKPDRQSTNPNVGTSPKPSKPPPPRGKPGKPLEGPEAW